MLTPDRIKTLIEADKASTRKRQAVVGERYYNAEHDILAHRIFFINAQDQLVEDTLKTNTRKVHPFFRENVDQEVQYLMSSEESIIRSDIPELQEALDERMNNNEEFQMHLREVLTDVITKGFGYGYCYKGNDGRTVFECADSLGVVEVRENETDDGCAYIITVEVERVDAEGRTIKRVKVFDEHNVHFYVQVDNGEITLDTSVKLNPRPHVIYSKSNGKHDDTKRYHNGGYGFIPFRRFDYNKNQSSGLNVIKSLIDNFDLMSSGLANNIEDTNEALYVVSGFEGDDLDELMMNIKAKKHIGITEGGKVEIQTINIPVEARKTMMELDEQNIYRFGMALNLHALKDTAATTNIAIKSAYSLLDLKAKKLETRLKSFLRWEIGIVLDEINQVMKTDYQQKDVYFVFNPEIPTNAEENARIELTKAQTRQTEINTLKNIQVDMDNETIMQLICEQLDIDYNDIKDKLPAAEETPGTDPAAAQNILTNLPTTEEVIADAE